MNLTDVPPPAWSHTAVPLPARPVDWPGPECEPIGSILDGYGATAFLITSFGYLHPDGIPNAHLTVDVRELLRDPHVDPTLRELTGLERDVREHVLATPGTTRVLTGVLTAAQCLYAHLNPRHEITRIAIGCAGGRHRSVVLANELGHQLNRDGRGRTVEIVHRDLLRPVVATRPGGAAR